MEKSKPFLLLLLVFVIGFGHVFLSDANAYTIEFQNAMDSSNGITVDGKFKVGGHADQLIPKIEPGKRWSKRYSGKDIGRCFSWYGVQAEGNFPDCPGQPVYGTWVSSTKFRCENVLVLITRSGCKIKLEVLGRGW